MSRHTPEVFSSDEPALLSDTYIDSLLMTRARTPTLALPPAYLPPPQIRQTIELLESRLPRFHPSFGFEERLAAQLQEFVQGHELGSTRRSARVVVELRVPAHPAALRVSGDGRFADRRLLLGGAALASGVSLAGAAMLVRARHSRQGRPYASARSRRQWLS